MNIFTEARRFGKLQAAIKRVHESLENGDVLVVVATTDSNMKDYYVKVLRENFKMEVTTEEVYHQPSPKLIFDPNDRSPEPKVLGIDHGVKKLYGYKFTKV